MKQDVFSFCLLLFSERLCDKTLVLQKAPLSLFDGMFFLEELIVFVIE